MRGRSGIRFSDRASVGAFPLSNTRAAAKTPLLVRRLIRPSMVFPWSKERGPGSPQGSILGERPNGLAPGLVGGWSFAFPCGVGKYEAML